MQDRERRDETEEGTFADGVHCVDESSGLIFLKDELDEKTIVLISMN